MKTKMITILTATKKGCIATLMLTILCIGSVRAQDEEESERTPARPAFESAQLLDMQSVVVPSKGTLEFDIQHRFGLVENGISDLYGLYAPSNSASSKTKSSYSGANTDGISTFNFCLSSDGISICIRFTTSS